MKPKVAVSPETLLQTPAIGDRVELKLDITSDKPVTIQFYRAFGPAQPNDVAPMYGFPAEKLEGATSNPFVIPSLKLSDRTGVYIASVTNEDGTSVTQMIGLRTK